MFNYYYCTTQEYFGASAVRLHSQKQQLDVSIHCSPRDPALRFFRPTCISKSSNDLRLLQRNRLHSTPGDDL